MLAYEFDIKETLNSPAEEAYRVLRTNIEFSALNNPIKVLSIVSPGHSDGKTTTTINLAIAMAKLGNRVLLIDADMRKPTIYKHFAGEKIAGLADVIAGKISFYDALCSTKNKNIHILTSGIRPPYPTEFLSSKVFTDVLEKAKRDYDFVIVDTPAMGSYIDGAVIAAKTDGVLILAKYKSAYYRSILRVKDQLEKANAKILGLILNNVSKSVYRDYYIMSHSYSKLKKSFDLEDLPD